MILSNVRTNSNLIVGPSYKGPPILPDESALITQVVLKISLLQ